MSIFSFIKTVFKRPGMKPETVDYENSASVNTVSPRKLPSQELMPGLYPGFSVKVQTLLSLARESGLNVDAYQTYRSFQDQTKEYAKGRTGPGKKVTNAKAGQSWHNYGLAVDIVFKTSSGKWSWAENNNWGMLGRIGKSLGLEWGGNWKSLDRPHFQLTYGLQLPDALSLYKSGGLEKVWSYLDTKAIQL